MRALHCLCSTRRVSVTDSVPFERSRAFRGTLLSIRLLKHFIYDACVHCLCSTRRVSVTDLVPFSWSQAFRGTLMSIRILKHLICDACAILPCDGIRRVSVTDFIPFVWSRVIRCQDGERTNIEQIMPLRPVDYSMPLRLFD